MIPALAAGLILVLSCTTSPSSPPAEGEIVEIHLLSPAENDTVAGEVDLEAAVRTPAVVLGVTFLSGSDTLAVVHEPPWHAVWSSDAPAEGRPAILSVTAELENGSTLRSAPVGVWVLPDAAPVVRVERPSRTRWIEQTPEAYLEAVAIDPEDGVLPGEQIRWYGEAMPRPYSGARLPLLILPRMELELTAEATDRWGRRGSATIRIRPFRYELPESPEAVMANLSVSLPAMDLTHLNDLLASDFRFFPCPLEAERAGWNPVWSRATFAQRLASWFQQEMEVTAWSWHPSAPLRWEMNGREHAWVICRTLNFAWIEGDAGLSASSHRIGESTVEGEESSSIHRHRMSGYDPTPTHEGSGAAAILLRRDADDTWHLVQWNDLPADGAAGLAATLAEASGLARPPAGPGCALP